MRVLGIGKKAVEKPFKRTLRRGASIHRQKYYNEGKSLSTHAIGFGKTGSWKKPIKREAPVSTTTKEGFTYNTKRTTISTKHAVVGGGITAVGAWGARGNRSTNKHPQTRGY